MTDFTKPLRPCPFSESKSSSPCSRPRSGAMDTLMNTDRAKSPNQCLGSFLILECTRRTCCEQICETFDLTGFAIWPQKIKIPNLVWNTPNTGKVSAHRFRGIALKNVWTILFQTRFSNAYRIFCYHVKKTSPWKILIRHRDTFRSNIKGEIYCKQFWFLNVSWKWTAACLHWFCEDSRGWSNLGDWLLI